MKRGLILFLAVGLMATAAWGADPAISVLENNVLCVRPSRVTDGLTEQLLALPATNRISGTILDLRFADGDDAAVDSAVKLFSAKKVPLVILANAETRGGAAELASRLRTAGLGLIIGSTNLPGGISPDISVAVSADAEKGFQANPYLLLPASEAGLSATNDLLPIIDHTSEAELVREKVKDGEEDDSGPTARPEPAQPVISDPEVARAVDLIKALAILQTTRG
jgi:hypothetical protein